MFFYMTGGRYHNPNITASGIVMEMNQMILLDMLILIAESKTMAGNERQVTAEEFMQHRPSGEETADEVMLHVARMSLSEISTGIKISPAMASRVIRMAYEFPNKGLGYAAIEAFTGVVFKEFGYDLLSPAEKFMTDSTVRIISSLYGWLRPSDIIKPYRFDFNTRLAPDNRTFSDYWRKDVTMNLVKDLQSLGEKTIINLLPGDAAKCIDWKLVKRFAKVYKVDFKELKAGGDYRTPHAGRLKAMRGELLREIIRRGITSPSNLLDLTTDNLLPLGTPDYPDHLAFLV